MSQWPSAKAKRVLAALLRIGWSIKRQSGSHKTLSREGWPDVVFAFHDNDEVGPKMLARIAKNTGLKPRFIIPVLSTEVFYGTSPALAGYFLRCEQCSSK